MNAYLTTAEVAELCRTSPDTVRYWRFIGKGPASFRVGRRVLYEVGVVEAWLQQRQLKDSCRQQADRWCTEIWGDRQGWALAVLGHGPTLRASKYAHSRFETRPYAWPKDRNRLLSELLPLANVCDVYVAPLLRSAPNRREKDSEPLPGRHVWLDADEWDAEREQVLLALEAPVLRVVSGGKPGKMHLYVDVGELLSGQMITEMARMLSRDCRTDTHGGSNKVLRLPGTKNHKPTCHGLPAGDVVILQ